MSEYTLIKGKFHVVGFSPDGDSLVFKANNDKNWEKFNTTYRDIFNERLQQNNGAVQLRLQGIDALETHYSPSRLPTPAHLKDKERDEIHKPKIKSYQQWQLSFTGTRRCLPLLFHDASGHAAQQVNQSCGKSSGQC